MKIKHLENLINQDTEMVDYNQQNILNKRSFVDLFKNNENNKIPEPVHDIINILNHNEEEKRKKKKRI